MSIGILKAEDKITETSNEKADMLNDQFVSVFTEENKEQVPDKGPSPHKPMNDIQITDNGVKKCINRLNEKKASGQDKIPITFFKQSADAITPALSFI